MSDELVVIVSAGHKWVRKRRVRAEELSGETFIVAAMGAGARAVVEERLQAKGIHLEKVLDFANAEGVKHAVEAGLGISIQPRGIVQREILAGSLKALRLADIDNEIAYVHIRHKHKHISHAEQVFLSLIPKKP
jgi:DNA-binding transcriptional LysR family regulator